MPPSPTALTALARLRGDFSPAAQRQKRRLLAALGRTPFRTSERLASLHDELLFLAAFPDNPTLAATAWKALATFHRRTRALSPRQLEPLGDTGIAGSTSLHTFMHGVVRWLVARGERLAPRWPDGGDAERLDALVRRTMLPAETDGFDDSGLSTHDWLAAASAGLPLGVMQWLVGGRSSRSAPGLRELYDDAEVPVAWAIGDSPRSVSRNRVPGVPLATRRAFRRLPQQPARLVATPLGAIRRLRGRGVTAWLDASLAALVARCREVSPTTYANDEEVYLADLGDGTALCVIGAHPDDRLALEANYGYVMFSNGIPIGYGGVTPLADQANTGANIFPSFRGSEAAYLYAQALRAFRTLFGVSRFVVNPYQFGAGNDEALQSGAYWFYDRLGFRAVDTEVAALASRERARLAADPGSRTSLATLRRLARSDVVLELDPSSPVARFDEHGLATIGARVAATLSHVPAADRWPFVMQLAASQKRDLTGSAAALTATERRGAWLLSPVLALIARRWPRWPEADRQQLWALVRAKGAPRERDFARRSRRHERLWRALAAVG